MSCVGFAALVVEHWTTNNPPAARKGQVNRIESGIQIMFGWLVALLLLPFYPIAYIIGWADEVVYRRRVMRDIRNRVRAATPPTNGEEE